MLEFNLNPGDYTNAMTVQAAGWMWTLRGTGKSPFRILRPRAWSVREADAPFNPVESLRGLPALSNPSTEEEAAKASDFLHGQIEGWCYRNDGEYDFDFDYLGRRYVVQTPDREVMGQTPHHVLCLAFLSLFDNTMLSLWAKRLGGVWHEDLIL